MLKFEKVLIQGILNVTPDSFSDGGLYVDVEKAVEHAKKLVADGADIIDIGGESSRPDAEPISFLEELNRVIPVVKRIVQEITVPLSIDTYKPEVAEACLQEGVSVVNDISGLRNQLMREVVSRYDVPAIIMHLPGNPQTMRGYQYKDVVEDVKLYLREQIDQAHADGVYKIIIDPGLGFGKTPEQNYEILTRLEEFIELGCPVLIGPSRKSFYDGSKKLDTLEAVALGVQNGVNMVRVHDVAAVRRYVDSFK